MENFSNENFAKTIHQMTDEKLTSDNTILHPSICDYSSKHATSSVRALPYYLLIRLTGHMHSTRDTSYLLLARHARKQLIGLCEYRQQSTTTAGKAGMNLSCHDVNEDSNHTSCQNKCSWHDVARLLPYLRLTNNMQPNKPYLLPVFPPLTSTS